MIDALVPEADLSLREFGTPLDTEQLSSISETARGSLTFMVLRGPG